MESDLSIPPGEIGSALKLRLSDSNKVVQSLALDAISRIAVGMGKPFDRHAKMFASQVCAVLADQKASARQAALATLTAMFEAGGIDALLSNFATALEAPNPALRKELLLWLHTPLADSTSADLDLLISPLLSCLEDRNPEVRKAAQPVLEKLVATCGYERVSDRASNLKPASRSTVMPLIESARSAAPTSQASAPSSARIAVPASVPTPTAVEDRPPAASVRALARPVSAVNKSLKSSVSVAQARSTTPALDDAGHAKSATPRQPIRKVVPDNKANPPIASSIASSSRLASDAPPEHSEALFRSADARFKPTRAAKEIGPLRWHIEATVRPEQIEYLHQQMSPHASQELLDLCFSKDHHAERDYSAALNLLDNCITDPARSDELYATPWSEMMLRFVANLDLIFKYLTLRLADSGTTLVLKCLDLLEHLLSMLESEKCYLSDYEASCLLPSLVNKVGDMVCALRRS